MARDDELVAGGGSIHPVAEALAKFVGADHTGAVVGNGASGTRTRDLLSATQALSQLSYSPRELDVGGKGNTRALGIPRPTVVAERLEHADAEPGRRAAISASATAPLLFEPTGECIRRER
jgi:hypothetical protein